MEHPQREETPPANAARPGQRHRLTRREVAEARVVVERLLAQGLGAREIARRAGVTRHNVYKWAGDLGRAPAQPDHPRRGEAIELLRQGLTPSEITARIGVPYSVLQGLRATLGLVQRPVPHPLRAEVEALLRQGLSSREISGRTGIPAPTLTAWRKDLDVLAPGEVGQPPRDPRRSAAEALLKDGLGLTEVARRTGVSRTSLQRWRAALGLRPTGHLRHPRRDQAEALLREGLATAEVAQRTGVSQTSLVGWRVALGLPPPERRPPRAPRPSSSRRHPQRPFAEALLREGLGHREVARRTGVSRRVVSGWRVALGLPLPPRRPRAPRPPVPRLRHPRRDQAEALLREGLPIAQVARRTGVSPVTLARWRVALGLPPSPARHPRREEAEALLRQGFSIEAVAGQTDASRTTVARWRAALGLPPSRPRPGTLPRAEIEDLLRRGESGEAIHNLTGVSVYRINKLRAELGLARRSPWPRRSQLLDRGLGEACPSLIDDLLRKGYHPRGVCRLLQVPSGMVDERRRWLGLPRQDEGLWIAMEKMFLEQLSVVEIARQVRLPVQRVVAFRRALGLDAAPGQVHPFQGATASP